MRIITLLFLFITLSPSISYSANTQTIFFPPEAKSLNLFSSIEILEDPSGTLTIDAIVAHNYQGSFKPASVTGNTFGFSESAYWVRFSLHVEDHRKTQLLLELQYPLLDNVTFFIPNKNNLFTIKKTGESHPFSERDIPYRNYTFLLPEQSSLENTYYMRLQSEGSISIPLTLWSTDAFIEHVNNSSLMMGLYYGIMWLVALIAIASYIKIRDQLFLSYAFYLITFLFFQASVNGFSFQYLWYDLPNLSSRFTSASIGLVIIGGLFFTGSFLQLWKSKQRYLTIMYFLLIVTALMSIILSLIGNYIFAIQLSAVAGIILVPVVMIATIHSVIIGYKPAYFFLAAWGIFLVGVLTTGLYYLGFLPSNVITIYAIQIGSVIEILVIGYALMYRLNLLQEEKELAVLQANDSLNKLNIGLESMVDERTQQLKEKNQKLSELAMHDSMTGLLNHNSSLEYLDKMKLSAQRYNKELAVIMVDIDLFKSINDTFGHVAGDKVITEIAAVLKKTVRESDICGRFGGEEFILILHESDAIATKHLAERIRVNIQGMSIDEIKNRTVTASLGIAMFNAKSPNADLLSIADRALYQAKKSGRNQVKTSPE